MRTCFILLFTFLTAGLYGQVAYDTVAVQKHLDSLLETSRSLAGTRNFEQAFETNAAAEKIILEKFGQESVYYACCCHNYGRICHLKNNFDDAEKWYRQDLDLREKLHAKNDPNYALTLNNMGLLYFDTGLYDDAERLYLEVLAIREKVPGKVSADYAVTLHNIGTLYFRMGNYEQAEPLLSEALALHETLKGKKSPEYASGLNSLSMLYRGKGEMYKAEELYFEALAIREESQGKNHPDYAGVLNNLGVLYLDMGNYEKTEKLYLESLSIREKTLGKEHLLCAQNMNNLAVLYMDINQSEKAEPLIIKALDIIEKKLGHNHLTYARSLNNLGRVYQLSGRYEQAEQVLRETMTIREKLIGKNHPDYASILNDLARLYEETGNLMAAEQLHIEALAIRGKTTGKLHPDYVKNLRSLSLLYQKMGKNDEAEQYFSDLAAKNRMLASNAVMHLSEQEMNAFIKTVSGSQDETLSFSYQTKSKNSASVCYDNSLFYKGFLINASSIFKRLIRNDTAATRYYDQLAYLKRRLAKLYSQPDADSVTVAGLEQKANTAEKELVRSVSGYTEASRQVSWQQVQSSLKPAEAAIEFVHFRVESDINADSVMYAALVLLPGNHLPEFIPLFEEKSLSKYLKSNKARKSDFVNSIYSVRKTDEKSMYDLVWKPLETVLTSVKTVYFSPSGLLYQINLSAIPVTEHENLGDRYHFVGLGSTRQLVVSSASPPARNVPMTEQAILLGGIQYEMNIDAIHAANTGLQTPMNGSRGAGSFGYADSLQRGGDWLSLPWTEKEVGSIGPILTSAGIQPTIRGGFAATEEFFKSIGAEQASPRILHVATHGYFFPDPQQTNNGAAKVAGLPAFRNSELPMIRSGLILAGGNQAWKTGKPFKPDMEDGILTAYEISQMDFSNTGLVVLSACETGLGDIKGNEGVYGLQRAFKIAGAKYLIMSLWQVPDFQTQELMTIFYQKWLSEQLSIPDAFRAAQQSIRIKYEHPYFWAGFVLME